MCARGEISQNVIFQEIYFHLVILLVMYNTGNLSALTLLLLPNNVFSTTVWIPSQPRLRPGFLQVWVSPGVRISFQWPSLVLRWPDHGRGVQKTYGGRAQQVRRHMKLNARETGWGISTETCGLDGVFRNLWAGRCVSSWWLMDPLFE